MNIALFSDIHANFPALESFFKDVDNRKHDAIFGLIVTAMIYAFGGRLY